MTTESEGPQDRPTPKPLFGKGALVALFAWGLLVLAFSAGGLADVTRVWWLVLLIGAAAPVGLVAVRAWASKRVGVTGAGIAERELLGALRKYGELTPTTAAMLTSVTAAEAAKTLEKLAREGHLEARVRDGTIAYAMRESDRLALSGRSSEDIAAPTQPSGATNEDGLRATSEELLEEPLSGRELAVLELLAAGRTNKEIAQELFIAQGTVKAHLASVYRKLGVHSRVEAASRAKDLGLVE
jgi:DNA-binding NarL/FixJ family response regulator